ncbi:MAG: prolyl oligopeptidase family serine peptidase, partial [Verrucomicrobiota bacterium]
RVLLTECDDAWINLNPAFPKWLADGSGFLWASERGGAWQVELRRQDGSLDRVIVPGTSGWQGLAELDEQLGELRFRASADPTREDVWTVPLRGGTPRRLTDGAGIQTLTFGATNGLQVLTTITATRMARWEVRTRDGQVLGTLPSVAEAPPFVPQVEFARVGDGEGWHVRITRPQTFEAGRKYPVIVDVYGGPHAQVVRQTMDKLLITQWLADQGFLVVAADGRGTPGRGRAWERALAGRLGPVPLAEQAAALRAMAQRWPELDLDRVGITGWSFGGYLSAYAVLREPGLFRAAVAGAPVIDWYDYDTHYTERYLGVPPAADAAYRESSCLTYAADLRRPLLLIHGTRDDNVFFRHSLRLVDALVRAGKPVEVLPLPGFTHMLPDPVVAEQRWLRTVEFFRRHLGSRGP